MARAGHRLVTPTYTGMGEREHLAREGIDLETHIDDMSRVLFFEDLRHVVLIGHSYGGIVATGIADRNRDLVAHLVYVDAFVPEDGESILDLQPPGRAAEFREKAKAADGWRIPPLGMPPDTAPEDCSWADPRRRPQPLKTFEQPLRLQNGPLTLPRSYIYAQRCRPDDGFRPSYERAQRSGWRTFEINASHNPHITAPEALMALLEDIVSS